MVKYSCKRPIRLVNIMTEMALVAMLAAPSVLAENRSTKLTESRSRKPLKVYILAGQSNMQSQSTYNVISKGLKDSPETKYLHDKLFDENGVIRVTENIYRASVGEGMFWGDREERKAKGIEGQSIFPEGGYRLDGNNRNDPESFGPKLPLGYQHDRFGPELTFGVTMYEKHQQPILIIKTAWGGKSLYEDFRPPTGKSWEPPKDSPDHPDNRPAPHPIPKYFSLPKDFEKPTRGKNMQICQGWPLDEMNGVSPIYVQSVYPKTKKGDLTDIPLQEGDLILGLNGEGLHGNAVTRWRDMWFNKVREGDWMLKITLLRDGKIETVSVDVARSLEGGRAALPAYVTEKKAEREKLLKDGGEYYHRMLERIRYVLADPGKFHPAYDPEQGYEIAGFVWFQGYNDKIASVIYPNGDKPRGYERYSWLLAQLIRSVRKELNVPKMPVVVGVFGQVAEDHPFAQAQAAVADYEEFKGNVVAVQTVKFNDKRIHEIQGKYDSVMAYDGGDPNHPYTELKAKVRAVKAKRIKDKSERKKAEMIAAGLTLEEAEYLQNNVCNQGFHYFGSPKFFMRAGEAFARGLISIMVEKQ